MTHHSRRHEIAFYDRKQGYNNSREFCRCPECNSSNNDVTLTRAAHYDGAKGIGRNRKCVACGHVWRTIEIAPEGFDAYDNNRSELIRRLQAKLDVVRKALMS